MEGLGAVNVAIMAGIAAFFIEKVLPGGMIASRAAAALLLAYGTMVLFVPDALPAMM